LQVAFLHQQPRILGGRYAVQEFVNIMQLVIDDLSAAPFRCYRRTTRRSWKNLRGRVGVVAILAVLDIPCPLTVLEDWLRTGRVGPQGFVQRWVSYWLYYNLPAWVFAMAYAVFLLVAVTWFRVPPRS